MSGRRRSAPLQIFRIVELLQGWFPASRSTGFSISSTSFRPLRSSVPGRRARPPSPGPSRTSRPLTVSTSIWSFRKGFHLACDDVKASRRVVVYPGKERYWIDSTAEVMPLAELIRSGFEA